MNHLVRDPTKAELQIRAKPGNLPMNPPGLDLSKATTAVKFPTHSILSMTKLK